MEGIIDTIRKLTRLDRIAFRRHSILRMRQRGIDVDDVKNALLSVSFGDGGNPSPSGEEKFILSPCDFISLEPIRRRT